MPATPPPQFIQVNRKGLGMDIEFGLDTFGDITVGDDGTPLTAAQTIRNIVEQAALADQVGVDFFGGVGGEHHRREFAVSSPEMVLAAIASRTERLRLGTAVTVLSSDDPVRVYERFATLDALSNGRAEVVLGRGSFTESFPLFGYDLRDYDRLFEEKLELFVELLKEEPVSWQGTVRAPLEDADVFPKTEKGMRTWVGVGGSPESVVRVARHGLGLMLAIIGGPAARFRPFVDLYHRSVDAFGNPALPVAVHSPGHIADTDEEAWSAAYPASRPCATRSARSEAGGARATAVRSSRTRSARRAPCTRDPPRTGWPPRSRIPCAPSASAASTSSTPPERPPRIPRSCEASSCTAPR